MCNSIFIKALYFGQAKPNGFTKSELEEHLGKKECEWGPLQNEFEQRSTSAFNQSGHKKNEGELFWLTKSGYMLLAELDDVRQARKEAKKAHWIAIVAIFASVIVPFLIKLFETKS
ncbi:hypothetical protein COU78_02890 [Candidatus Peregrinibacteria bacterium CG10_big_fil_rev_8_21_14_0_10_49_24]|nr:MAG: hypothetical protein COV83_06725 [Candidatus Peregrinibacteria bacterium CG11_big_fil_rev_8_21_14_0_20_49_14]PIR51075.1 MAG: hypothetical protein COU78_02890 [Candidatus Peregrinibacteria bacterium CG10_big_fil_rev_8_21_14_0_10_49_24]PJA67628.1 MAG: hypothetical protein CO157_04370 [Candidatus Peregrinibacteria bacterium CG_4_9_14_3_um_filter_49_12]